MEIRKAYRDSMVQAGSDLFSLLSSGTLSLGLWETVSSTRSSVTPFEGLDFFCKQSLLLMCVCSSSMHRTLQSGT